SPRLKLVVGGAGFAAQIIHFSTCSASVLPSSVLPSSSLAWYQRLCRPRRRSRSVSRYQACAMGNAPKFSAGSVAGVASRCDGRQRPADHDGVGERGAGGQREVVPGVGDHYDFEVCGGRVVLGFVALHRGGAGAVVGGDAGAEDVVVGADDDQDGHVDLAGRLLGEWLALE